MRVAFTTTRIALLLCTFWLLPGCLRQDSISITNDGRVSFESTVTEPDEEKKLDFAAFEKAIAPLLEELRQGKWKIETTWTSKQRPFGAKITGSGKLSDVAPQTSLYQLGKLNDKRYKFVLLEPMTSHVHAVFQSPADSAIIVDAAGKPVHDIDGPKATEVFTIVLR